MEKLGCVRDIAEIVVEYNFWGGGCWGFGQGIGAHKELGLSWC